MKAALEIKPAYDDIDNIKTLFAEYVDLLINLDDDFKAYLQMQKYDDEYDDPGAKYSLPGGRLYIAYYREQSAGCVALRRLNAEACEMKRMYVRPRYRRLGIAKALAETIIGGAKAIGYKYMLLDTLPAMRDAIALYEKLGFYRINPYNDSPVKQTVYMKLDL